MLISKIQSDLFDFIDRDPDDAAGLIEFWYMANNNALSAALTKHDGLKLIVNVSSFEQFEKLSKKLFLVADTLVVRDTRKWVPEEDTLGEIPMPADGNYKPGYFDEVIEELKTLRPSPLTLNYRPPLQWSSSTKMLNNGLYVAYAAWAFNQIPQNFKDWIFSSGREYLKTGKIVYAPFIPTFEMELEFLNKGLSVPDYFNSMPCFDDTFYHNVDSTWEWLANDKLLALLSLKLPFLDNIDIETLSKVKEDYYEEFATFSSGLLQSINSLKSNFGTENFAHEVKYIQRNKIDDELNNIEKTVKRMNNIGALRKLGVLTGFLGVNASMYRGLPNYTIPTGLATSVIGFIMERIEGLKANNELKDKKGYFLWKLKGVAPK
ncbi:MAG: hypothetical protein IPJ09_05900 [Saprospiraceae bacterium]|nr:hypothetical protein [Saprospiraceae bacterium]